MNTRTLSIVVLMFVFSLAFNLATTDSYALVSGHQCADCHSVMGASGSTLLNETSVEVLCMSCHATAVGSVAAAEVHTNGGSSFPANRITCLGCHDPHDHQQNINGVDNLNMVLATITVMNPSLGYDIDVVFSDKDNTADGSYDYSKPDGTGVCQVCHTLTKNQLNDGSKSGHGVKTDGSTCATSCHPHSRGFDR